MSVAAIQNRSSEKVPGGDALAKSLYTEWSRLRRQTEEHPVLCDCETRVSWYNADAVRGEGLEPSSGEDHGGLKVRCVYQFRHPRLHGPAVGATRKVYADVPGILSSSPFGPLGTRTREEGENHSAKAVFVVDTLRDGITHGSVAMIRNDLILNNLALAHWCVVNRFSTMVKAARLEHDDAISLATTELIKAARDYNPARCKFSTLAVTYIRNGLMGEVVRANAACRSAKPIPFSVLFRSHDDETPTEMVEFSCSDPEPPLLGRRELHAAIRKIPYQRERDTLWMMLRGMNLREMGERAGISKERCRQLKKTAIERLRGILLAGGRQRKAV